MRHIAALTAIACLTLAFMEVPLPNATSATGDSIISVPVTLRQKNWTKGGSCVHASMMVLFRWMGRPDIAKMWGEKYNGGEYWYTLEAKLRAEKIDYASTHGQEDVSFLEWAMRTRRGCIAVTTVGNKPEDAGNHMLTLVELDETRAGYIDSNDISKVLYMPRDKFIKLWIYSGSWACTPLLSPPPKELK